jgi:anti-sigma factor RsiW
MDCQRFRSAHLDFTDGTLPAAEHRAAQEHLDACPACARFDCRTRRALLLVRNLPAVGAAPGFYPRLQARLALEARADVIRGRLVTGVAAAALLVGFAAGSFVRAGIPGVAETVTAPPPAAPIAAVLVPPPSLVQRDGPAHTVVHFTLWPEAGAFDKGPAHFASSEAPPFTFAR